MEKPAGKLVYSVGQSIYSLGLEDLRAKPIFKVYGFFNQVRRLSKKDKDHVLFGVDRAQSYDSFILEYDLKSHQTKKILEHASFPLYMPKANKLLFNYYASPNEKWGFYVSDFDRIQATMKKIGTATGTGYDTNVIPVSDDTVVFSGRLIFNDDRSQHMWSYNVNTDTLAETKISTEDLGCFLWMENKKRLLCIDTEGNFFLTTFENEKQKVNFFMSASKSTPVLYISRYDQLVWSVPSDERLIGLISEILSLSESSDLWIYDFKTQKRQLLFKGYAFMLGNGVYVED